LLNISLSSQQLPEAFVKADFEFYKRVLDGQQDDKPRWKKMLGLLDRAVGEALGELYVKEVRLLSGNCIF
jgi:putative endopeptidase